MTAPTPQPIRPAAVQEARTAELTKRLEWLRDFAEHEEHLLREEAAIGKELERRREEDHKHGDVELPFLGAGVVVTGTGHRDEAADGARFRFRFAEHCGCPVLALHYQDATGAWRSLGCYDIRIATPRAARPTPPPTRSS